MREDAEKLDEYDGQHIEKARDNGDLSVKYVSLPLQTLIQKRTHP